MKVKRSGECIAGKHTYLWQGTELTVVIMDPEHIREVTQKVYIFQRPHSNPLLKLLVQGLASYNGDKWTKHRKLINPAFHVEKLKVLFSLILFQLFSE